VQAERAREARRFSYRDSVDQSGDERIRAGQHSDAAAWASLQQQGMFRISPP